MFKKCIRKFSTKTFPLKYGLNPNNKLAESKETSQDIFLNLKKSIENNNLLLKQIEKLINDN